MWTGSKQFGDTQTINGAPTPADSLGQRIESNALGGKRKAAKRRKTTVSWSGCTV
jgi:hypothetical protein